MYDPKEARSVLEEIKRGAAEGEHPDSISVSSDDISTVLKPLQSWARFPQVAWQIQQAQIVVVRPISEAIPGARDRRRAKQNISVQACYYNAVKVCRKLGARYCEGWFVSPTNGLLIRHGWNRLNGAFFDVTGEQFYEDFRDLLYVWSFEVGPQEAEELWKSAKKRFYGDGFLAVAHWERERGLGRG